jgi:hypothetical protein
VRVSTRTVGQQRGVRRVVNVRFHDSRVDAQPPAVDDPSLPPPEDQLGQQILEDRLVQHLGQADQRLGIRRPLAIDSAEGAIDQTAAHLPLALVEAPVVQMLQHQHPQDHVGGGPESAPTLTLGMALGQRLRDTIHECVVVEQGVDPAEGGIPELVGVGQEHFHETALPVRSPHHGVSGEATRPPRVHRVSCAVARRVTSRGSLTIAHRSSARQRRTVHSVVIPPEQAARTAVALRPIRTGT